MRVRVPPRLLSLSFACVRMRSQWIADGGRGYDYVGIGFVPFFEKQGVTCEALDDLLINIPCGWNRTHLGYVGQVLNRKSRWHVPQSNMASGTGLYPIHFRQIQWLHERVGHLAGLTQET